MTMQGKKMPQGTAVPDVMYVKNIQLPTKMIMLDYRNLLPSVIKIFRTSVCLEKNIVARR
jgi:hypothetical protein